MASEQIGTKEYNKDRNETVNTINWSNIRDTQIYLFLSDSESSSTIDIKENPPSSATLNRKEATKELFSRILWIG